MQLLVVTPYYFSDTGVANAARGLTQELMKLGVELVAVVHADSYTNNSHNSTPAMSIGIRDNLFSRTFKEYLLSRRAADSLKLLKSDYGDNCVIHSHSLYPSASVRNSYDNAVFVTTVHGVNTGELERFKREKPMHPQELRYRLVHRITGYGRAALIRRSQGHFIALSAENASSFLRLGLSPSRIHLIPNGVDIDFFRPDDCIKARRKLSLPTDKLLVLTISSINPRKGLHTLIKAARTVVNEEPDAYFVVVGHVFSGHRWYMTYLKQLLRKLKLEKHFKFVGFVSKEELPLYMNAADIFALASTAEGAPLVVPQAMACRRIVIATKTAAADYLPPNLVAPNGRSDELAQKLSFYLSNTKERRLISEELYQKATNELSWANVARQTLDLYRKMIDWAG